MRKLLIVVLVFACYCSSCNNKSNSSASSEDTTLYINCMIDVAMQLQEDAIGYGLQIAEKAREMEGCVFFDVYCSTNKHEKEKILFREVWSSPQAYQNFLASEAYNQIVVSKMKKMCMCYEQKLYPEDTQVSAFSKTELRLNCPATVKMEYRDSLISLASELVEASRQDEGCINYDLMQSCSDSTQLMIFESWTDQDALDAHSSAPHFTRLVPQIHNICEMKGLKYVRNLEEEENKNVQRNYR